MPDVLVFSQPGFTPSANSDAVAEFAVSMWRFTLGHRPRAKRIAPICCEIYRLGRQHRQQRSQVLIGAFRLRYRKVFAKLAFGQTGL